MSNILLGSLDRESLEKPGVRTDRHFFWEYVVECVQKALADGDAPLPRHPNWSRLESVLIQHITFERIIHQIDVCLKEQGTRRISDLSNRASLIRSHWLRLFTAERGTRGT